MVSPTKSSDNLSNVMLLTSPIACQTGFFRCVSSVVWEIILKRGICGIEISDNSTETREDNWSTLDIDHPSALM